ncbi:cellulose synthase/poly-beta-1,6-N-acetylglucosamine synthase-like glycosyltransferase [Halanaerobium saccharolyticum]|uniref:Cellulose synthase/poly-beta-1,6-N-acetylglucosamine synthase-like glycosyltransferase n=1 Tax=Halanaerobium saccharolyticum TaxID=43595 RepID=A0A4R7YSF4_9FIRM|nr:glycosyltransferase [Halanaerobium saccharolyticum]RAK06365.1 cellulose synthase/poly-beta-1,6-N-acetylglucosamine synthase-like glycosyltransferase [Halanaerobium saccharolyticum]TDW00677.1 cellulose synthase/poly-beta-1,6-N-acetylglucosamine synthase-like glycosyltransferase [Halanaerobium saccharolyticum]TDX52290.1 cellulose synthase/poly-beta-1,6-N-acetylglucosamine synthase-like glycosyltransferase [Halanaerobium saccharolyticum]
MDNFYYFLLVFDYFAVIYFFLVNGTYLFLNVKAFFSIRKYWSARETVEFENKFQSEFYKPVSIIIPAYNEELTVVDNITSILSLQYPEYEVVVVNDGSKDATIEELKDKFNLVISSRSYRKDLETLPVKEVYDSTDYPNLVVVDKENGGKADALNAGINIAQFPLVCNVDADSLIDDHALLKIVEPFAKDWRVIAAGGTIRVANDCEIRGGQVTKVRLAKKPLVRMQVLEYLRAFLFGRVGWAALNSLLIISGAFGVFKRKHLIEVGGYSTDTVGEDMELVLKLNRMMKKSSREYRVVFFPDPVCWTQVPEDIKTLSNQRRRWQRGLGQSLLMNKEIFFNKDYGLLGLFTYPFYFFVEFLGPVIETLGYLAIILTIFLQSAITPVAVLFFITAVLMGILLSIISLLFEEMTFHKYNKLSDKLSLILYAFLENLGYKQLHTYWRLRGIIDLILKKESWGTQKRKNF